jgi:hypothetical protein
MRQIDPGRYACPYDSKGFSESDLRKAKPLQLIRSAKARKNAMWVEPTPLYQQSEGAIFNLLCADYNGGVAPYPYVDVTNGDGAVVGTQSVRVAAWSALYLYSVIAEDRRPAIWISLAKTKLRAMADYLLTQQVGLGYVSSAITAIIATTATTDLEYGGFITMETSPTYLLGTVYAEDVSAGGLALLRAYQVLDDPKYQAGYRAALMCLRRMQCGGKLTNNFASTDSAGTGIYNSGMFDHKISVYDGLGLGGGPEGGGASLLLQGNSYGGATTTEAVSSSSPAVVIDWTLLPGSTYRVHLACNVSVLTGGSTLTARIRVGGTSAADGTAVVTTTTAANGVVTASSAILTKPAAIGYVKWTMQTDVGTATVTCDAIVVEIL